MKFCSRPWDFWYLIDAEEGQVWPCAWFNAPSVNIGNIHKQSVEEIMNSPKLKELQESILDGSFSFCDKRECAYLANDTLPDLTEEEIKKITSLKYPNHFNVAYDETCTHACPSCRKEIFRAEEGYYNKVRAINEKMLPYYNQARRLTVNGRGDIFACKNLLEMLSKLRPERDDFELVIETNAALFDEKHWKWLDHLSKFTINVMLTVNSFKDSTYRYLSGYSNHVNQVIENLYFIKKLKEQGKINTMTMSMIVQEPNFRELPEYVDRCLNEFGADQVRIRGIMKFDMDEQDFWFKDVFNPAHPYYKEVLEILDDPILKDERVWFWEGDYKASRQAIENPYEKFRIYYDLLWKMLELNKKNKFDKILERFNGLKIAIYGAGHVGMFLADQMYQKKYDIIGVYDKQADKKDKPCNFKLIAANQTADFSNVDVVINTVDAYEAEVRDYLEQRMFKGKFISISDIVLCK